MMRAAATGSSVSSSSMPINFDFSRNVTLFRFQSNTGFEYFCVLLFTFTLAYVQEYIAFVRKKRRSSVWCECERVEFGVREFKRQQQHD